MIDNMELWRTFFCNSNLVWRIYQLNCLTNVMTTMLLLEVVTSLINVMSVIKNANSCIVQIRNTDKKTQAMYAYDAWFCIVCSTKLHKCKSHINSILFTCILTNEWKQHKQWKFYFGQMGWKSDWPFIWLFTMNFPSTNQWK